MVSTDDNFADHRLRLLAYLAIGMYVAAQVLPAIQLGSDWIFGGQATYLAFVGLASPNQVPSTYWLACVMGVAANLLMAAAFLGYWNRRTGLALVASSIASVLAIGVLLPLAASHELHGVHLGHLIWVGSTVLMAIACASTDLAAKRRAALAETVERLAGE